MSKKVKTKASKPMTINKEERTIQVVMTTNEVDRDKDIVETSGIDTKNFEENPVVLWAHDPSQPPIGAVIELDKQKNMMLGTVKFADTPRAQEIFDLYEQGIMKTWSIGFSGKQIDYLKSEEGDIMGYHFKESELLELSAVPIPANPSALVRACKNLKDNELKEQFQKILEESTQKPEPKKGSFSIDGEKRTLTVDGEEKDISILCDSAFKKSSKEAGSAGKVPVTVSFGEEKGIEITFEVVKEEDEKITECKMTSVCVSLTREEKSDTLTHEEPSRDDEESSEDVGDESSAATDEMAKSLAEMRETLIKSCGM